MSDSAILTLPKVDYYDRHFVGYQAIHMPCEEKKLDNVIDYVNNVYIVYFPSHKEYRVVEFFDFDLDLNMVPVKVITVNSILMNFYVMSASRVGNTQIYALRDGKLYQVQVQ